jgi:hypothetical protein
VGLFNPNEEDLLVIRNPLSIEYARLAGSVGETDSGLPYLGKREWETSRPPPAAWQEELPFMWSGESISQFAAACSLNAAVAAAA